MGQKVVIRFWWESGSSSASRNQSHHFLQTFRPLCMFKIVFHDSSLYPKPMHLFCLLRLISASANPIGYNQGSPNFFVRGPHMLLHNSLRAGLLTVMWLFRKRLHSTKLQIYR